MRHHNKLIRNLYLFFFDRVTRDIEKNNDNFTGATYYLIGCLLTVIFFKDTQIIVSSLLIMSISDSFASIIGIKFGNTIIYKNKSLEGSFSFLISSFIILIIFVPELSLFNTVFIVFIVTLVELFSNYRINDNITIPIASALLINFVI